MTKSRPEIDTSWRPLIAGTALVMGFLLLIGSFVWPKLSVGRGAWTTEQAREYQAASAKLHSLSHEYANPSKNGLDPAARDKLRQARDDFETLHTQLDSAVNRPRTVAMVLRFVAVAMIAGGAFVLLRARSG